MKSDFITASLIYDCSGWVGRKIIVSATPGPGEAQEPAQAQALECASLIHSQLQPVFDVVLFRTHLTVWTLTIERWNVVPDRQVDPAVVVYEAAQLFPDVKIGVM